MAAIPSSISTLPLGPVSREMNLLSKGRAFDSNISTGRN